MGGVAVRYVVVPGWSGQLAVADRGLVYLADQGSEAANASLARMTLAVAARRAAAGTS